MLLAVDAGNSSVSFAVFRGSEVFARFHMPYSAQPVTAENVRRELESRGMIPTTISHLALACVGPHLRALQRELRQLGHAPLLTVEVDPHFGMPLAYANPSELGVDRWLNAIAAYELYRRAVIVVDMGTATNFECVSDSGEFLGGAICIGPQLSLDALCQRSSKLPPIQLTAPEHVLANNPGDALRSGAYYGHAATIDGMVARLSAEMATPVTVVGTGGYCALLAPACRSLHVIEPDLTLHGVRLAWEHHRDRTRAASLDA